VLRDLDAGLVTPWYDSGQHAGSGVTREIVVGPDPAELHINRACLPSLGHGPEARWRPSRPLQGVAGAQNHPAQGKDQFTSPLAPGSTAGPRSCAGSLTSASAPTSRPTSGGSACTGRSCTVISR
jgi:hypothetical protein